MFEHDGNSNTIGFQSVKRFVVLIVDPEEKLKLVKWRLQSDGHRVLYTSDLTNLESLISGQTLIILVNIENREGLAVLKKIRSIKGNYAIIAITSASAAKLKKDLFAAGTSKLLSKPVDFPKLSAAVNEEMLKLEKQQISEVFGDVVKENGLLPLELRTLYKSVLDHVKTAVLLIDREGTVTFANRPMSALLEVNEKYLVGKDFREIMEQFTNPRHHELLAILKKTLEQWEISSCNEVLVSGDSDDIVPCEAEARPVFDKGGDFMGAFLTVGDIGNPGKMEQVMAQSEKLALVGQLAAGAAHEIRNPLTSVKGFIQLLQNEVEGTPKADYFNIIIDEIDRVTTIINEFLKLARPALPNRQPYSLKSLWESIKVLIESEAFLKNVTICEDLSDNLPPILIDGEQIKQVLINIVRNSFEAMAGGGKMTVRAFELERDRQLCLEISDTGVGMDEETVRRIFVPFFTTKDNGTGLGLAVSSTIMESHGGYIEVTSTLGQGTVTRLYFPYRLLDESGAGNRKPGIKK